MHLNRQCIGLREFHCIFTVEHCLTCANTVVKCEIQELEVTAEPTLKDARGDCYITYFFTLNISSSIPTKIKSVPNYFSAPLLYLRFCMSRAIHK